MSYAPLDDSTPYSSVNLGGGPTVLAVWCLILASKDQDGVTSMTPEGAYALWLGSREPRPLEDIQAAWDFLAAPDVRSKNQEHEGRRIIPTEDGRWFVVSHHKYREKYREEVRRRQWAQAQKKVRETKKQEQEGDAPTPHETPSPAAVVVQPPQCFLPEVSTRATRTDLTARGGVIWEAHYGAGSVDWGRLGAALKPLGKGNQEEVVLIALQRYVNETTHPSPSPQDFKSHFSDWLPTGKGAGRAVVRAAVVRDVEQENRDSLARIKAKRGEE